MSKTYYSLNVHVIFSTKKRSPFLQGDLLDRTHRYLVGTINGLGGKALRVGGVADHVHLLFGMKSTDCVATMVREIKKATTNWIREEVPGFSWQVGYAAFSVSPERIMGVTKYIESQQEHHKTLTFAEERIMLFRLANVEFDLDDLD
jgi:putative transposase